MAVRPRLALIHATPVAVDPIRDALAAGWPEAEAVNILDDSLTTDRALNSELTSDLTERIVRLAVYARDIGSSGILFTCSAFGPAIDKAADFVGIPVLKPNEAMYEAALQRGRKVALIVTFVPSRLTMEAEFEAEAKRRSPGATLTSLVVEPAMAALRAGDAETHNRLVADKVREAVGYDAILLAHFSTARAAPAARVVTTTPVLTSPEAAVAKMRRMVTEGDKVHGGG